MLDTVKKCIFYFNGFVFTVSYMFYSLVFALFAYPLGFDIFDIPYKTKQILTTVLKPIEFIFNITEWFLEQSYGFAIYVAMILLIIVSILTPIFLRKELSKRTVLLLSFSFVLPLAITILCFVIECYHVLEYITYSISALLFLVYGITTLVFMHKDNDELDW